MAENIKNSRAIYIISLLVIAWFQLKCNGQVNGRKEAENGNDEIKKKLEQIILPNGFKIEVYAMVPNARSMTMSPEGILYVGSRGDKVYAVKGSSENQKANEVIEIDSGLNSPNGVAFKNGNLYVAEINRIIRYDNIEKDLRNPPKPVVIYDKYPSDEHHGWKFIRFGPDNKLYVPVGAPCNTCEEKNPIYSTITRLNADGTEMEIFSHGIRNTVGFDWHPVTNELWFTENGADRMGDNIPPDELNRAPRKGMHYGFPYCHGDTIPDPKYGKNHHCAEFTAPMQKLGPHVAALGMRFYQGNMFPKKYYNQIFIAEHGSWNRSTPLGYRVMMITLESNQVISYESFAEGWLEDNGEAWGRPVDVEVMKGGALLVSDDKAGIIYKISHN